MFFEQGAEGKEAGHDVCYRCHWQLRYHWASKVYIMDRQILRTQHDKSFKKWQFIFNLGIIDSWLQPFLILATVLPSCRSL